MKPQSAWNRQPTDSNRLGRELFGLIAIFFGLLFLLSLATFDSRDPWLNHVVSGVTRIHNKAGLFGAYLAGFLYDMLGVGGWVIPTFLCLEGARRVLGAGRWLWWRRAGFILLILCVCLTGTAHDIGTVEVFPKGGLPREAGNISSHGGGILGHMLYVTLVGWLSAGGAFLVWLFVLLLATQILFGFSWLTLATVGSKALRKTITRIIADAALQRRIRKGGQSLVSSGTLSVVPAEYAPLSSTCREKEYSSEAAISRLPFTCVGSIGGGVEVAATPNEDGLFRLPEADAGIFLAAPGQRPCDTFVHPLLSHTDKTSTEPPSSRQTPDTSGPGSRARGRGVFSLARSSEKEEEKDLPLWVRDFEENRIGMQCEPDKTAMQGKERREGDTGMQGAPCTQPSVSAQNEVAVPIFAAPPVEAAPLSKEPGLMGKVVRRIKKAKPPLPSLDLLEATPSSKNGRPREELEAKGRILMTCLNDFGVQGELVGITPGPVVTMFEVRPAPGVRVSRIANLSDDLALALKAVAVRIQAPVPGTDTVGIEIPNEKRETVGLKELLGSQLFRQAPSLLTLALGKDSAGLPAVADLASMPHLLVAGATGAGKSVGINSIILSLLYKARPEEVKLLLVDPKRVEMAIYADLPHLVHPVVTEMAMAKNALEWAVAEMEKRYNAIARAGVRNITDYNAKLAAFGETPPEGLEDLEPMPYLVLIIDELADLMLVAAKEVETSIVRLAQLARAAGIHLILATQRPSVDVVTGLIKANFPCRISFQVTSKHDSRTILDTVGAEHLLGRGDMLFKPGGGKFRRMHGAFVSDRDVYAVVNYWRSRQKPDYQIDFAEWLPEGTIVANGSNGSGGGNVDQDPMYGEAVEFVHQQGKASISLIQRKFRIGFNKAARFVEQMEHDGIIGPADGSKPRLLLR